MRTVVERIRQRRAQMLVHSCIYYELNDNIVSDDAWQRWADELVELQREYKEPIGFFDYEFRDWTAATGAHLPHRHPWVYTKAQQLLRLANDPQFIQQHPDENLPAGHPSPIECRKTV